jgi:flavin reductase (DIM6/NTAB) family NADH-FMN oxidoreductase RutF
MSEADRQLHAEAPRPATFRHAMGQFSTGVTVVTAVVDGEPHGMTANAFTSASLEPPLVVIALARTTRMLARVTAAGAYAVTVLSAAQRSEAEFFATPGRPTGAAAFAHWSWRAAPVSGAPVLVDGLAWFDCSLIAAHPAGDHQLCVGHVDHLAVIDPDGAPLRWFRGALL